MIDKPENPPAFPYVVQDTRPDKHFIVNGMTLRDWFAGQALIGLHANPDARGGPEAFARDAYAQADAMLTERTKP